MDLPAMDVNYTLQVYFGDAHGAADRPQAERSPGGYAPPDPRRALGPGSCVSYSAPCLPLRAVRREERIPPHMRAAPPRTTRSSVEMSRRAGGSAAAIVERDRHRTLSNHPLSEIAPQDRLRNDYEKHGRPQ